MKMKNTIYKKNKIVELNIIKEISNKMDFKVPLGVPLFEAMPLEIIIENFEPMQSITRTFKLRNRDAYGRMVKISFPKSPVFTVKSIVKNKGETSEGSKVASEMDIT